MQKILDIAYSNVACIEDIVWDILALFIGYGLPVFVFLLALFIVVAIFATVIEFFVDCLIARKKSLKDKVALLDNGDRTWVDGSF